MKSAIKTLILFAVTVIFTGCGSYVEVVKNGTLPDINPNVTMEGAYNACLDNCQWRSIKGTKGEDIVEVTGELKSSCKYWIDGIDFHTKAYKEYETYCKILFDIKGGIDDIMYEAGSIRLKLKDQNPVIVNESINLLNKKIKESNANGDQNMEKYYESILSVYQERRACKFTILAQFLVGKDGKTFTPGYVGVIPRIPNNPEISEAVPVQEWYKQILE